MSRLLRHVEPLAGVREFLTLRFTQTDLIIGKVAGRVWSPGVPEVRVGPHPQTAAAGIKEPAQPAPALDPRPPVPQPFQQRLIRIGPDLAEGPL